MPSVDMDKVVNSTVQQLGAENALLRLELNAQRAANDALTELLAELEGTTEGGD
jgi:hypothetical protein